MADARIAKMVGALDERPYDSWRLPRAPGAPEINAVAAQAVLGGRVKSVQEARSRIAQEDFQGALETLKRLRKATDEAIKNLGG
jgi:hypothetical protein